MNKQSITNYDNTGRAHATPTYTATDMPGQNKQAADMGMSLSDKRSQAEAYVNLVMGDKIQATREELVSGVDRQLAIDENLVKIQPLPAFMESDHREPPQIIKGMLHRGGKMSLSANSKIGKTWTLLHLGVAVAEGRPWLGFDTTKSKVLYINFELQDWDVHNRIAVVLRALDIDRFPSEFHICNLRGKLGAVAQLLPILARQLAGKGFGLIILDPLYKLYKELDENKAGDVAQLMAELEQVCEQTKAAVLFSHHYSKGNQASKEAIDRSSGSGVFGRDPDSIVNITKHADEGCFIVEADLRSFKRIEPFGARQQFPLLLRDATVSPRKFKRSGSSARYTKDVILDVMCNDDYTTAEIMDAVVETSEMSESTFHRLFKNVRNMDCVSQDPETKVWRYRPASPDRAQVAQE